MMFGPTIAPFAPAEGLPPQTTWRFFRWAVQGAWPAMLWAGFWSACAGSLEAISATILGHVIDAANTANRATVFTDHFWLFAVFVGFYLIARPLIFGINTSAASITVEPNLFPLILSRLHRFTIGQAVTFFDNDFAGRIAQKQMQVARATTDVVAGIIETGAFGMASAVGSVALLAAIDLRIAGLLVLWIIAYVLFIRGFLKRIRSASATPAVSLAN